jgi:hypothetical protein
MIDMRHVRLDENGRYLETMKTGLNDCLTISANKDQIGSAFIRDIVISMFDEGSVAIVPVDTTMNPRATNSWDILSMRTAKVLEWYPNDVRLDIYNDEIGRNVEKVLPKARVAVIENPFYEVMNRPNSTLNRLIHKLNILDAIDEQSGSGKLDIVVQSQYPAKSESRKIQARQRREEIEAQMKDSKYGVAYIDSQEKIIQLNRPAENQLMAQIEYLTSMLYSQLGVSLEILNGTADEKLVIQYNNRTLHPILEAITGSMRRSFLTKTATTQGQSIVFFKDPFSLVPASELATISDSMTRNAILSSNDIRSILGYKPDKDPEADKLRNKNLNPPTEGADPTAKPGAPQNGINLPVKDPSKGDRLNADETPKAAKAK